MKIRNFALYVWIQHSYLKNKAQDVSVVNSYWRSARPDRLKGYLLKNCTFAPLLAVLEIDCKWDKTKPSNWSTFDSLCFILYSTKLQNIIIKIKQYHKESICPQNTWGGPLCSDCPDNVNICSALAPLCRLCWPLLANAPAKHFASDYNEKDVTTWHDQHADETTGRR